MPPLAAVPNLERELDALYALPLESFTKARNDLAARLRKAHQTEAAESVRALRKPTLPVWTANRLARVRPDLVAELVDAGSQLRRVQQRALAGRESQAEVSAAAKREREALGALLAAARAELRERVSPQLLERLSQTLRGAAVDPAAAAVLAAGRLSEELHPVGFGPLEVVAPRRRPPNAAERERVKQLRAEARRLEAEALRAARAADEAERDAARLRREADELEQEAERAATALAAASTGGSRA